MSKGAILVSGGAGYIGSHTVRMLAEEAGYQVVVIDNLVFGHREALVSEGVSLVEANIADEDAVEEIFTTYNIAGVVHFAAFCFVGESVTDPLKYYANNTAAPCRGPNDTCPRPISKKDTSGAVVPVQYRDHFFRCDNQYICGMTSGYMSLSHS